MFKRRMLGAALSLGVFGSAGLGQAITLDLPGPSTTAADRSERLTSYDLPIGPHDGSRMATRVFEGPLSQVAYRIAQPGLTTLELLAPLRQQLVREGFAPVFECETATCGGFDFRFATSVLPEPDMHVDLGDFRFFAAARGTEAVSLFVSRSAAAGFVQMTHVGGTAGPQAVLTTSTKAPAAPTPSASTDAAPRPATTAGTLGAQLLAGGAVALDDLVFASGTADLAAGSYDSLKDLAQWLAENPKLRVALVGHTDASGGLAGNIALSKRRAESVRQNLIQTQGVRADQIEAQGVGYLSPRASNLTDAGRDKNRRVEVILTSTQVKP